MFFEQRQKLGYQAVAQVVNIEDFDEKSGGKYPFFESYQESASPNGAKSIRKNILFVFFNMRPSILSEMALLYVF